MNKKGQFSNFVFGMVGLFVLILILTSLMAVKYSEGNIDKNKIYNTLDNTSINVMNDLKVNESNGVIINVVYSFINFILYSSFEVTKAAVGYGIDNPEFINPNTLLWIVIISLCIPIVWYGFLMITSLFLIIKEWHLNRKEKKALNKIKEERK